MLSRGRGERKRGDFWRGVILELERILELRKNQREKAEKVLEGKQEKKKERVDFRLSNP